MLNNAREKVKESLRETLPPFFKIGNQPLFKVKTIYNRVCHGDGPEIIHIRGKRYLERESFLKWAFDETKACGKRGPKRAA